MSRKAVVVGGLVFALVAGGVWYAVSLNGARVLRLPGIVEIQEVRLGSKVGGRVSQVLVQEGDIVSPGKKLVVFEVPEIEAMRDQLKARLAAAQAELDRAINGARTEEKKAAFAAAEAAKARLDRLVEGWREEEKRQTKSELDSAEAEYKQASEDLARISDLYRMKSVSRAEYDAALSFRDRSRGRFNSARAKNDMMLSGARKEDVAEAKADWERFQAKADELYNGTREEDKALARAKVVEAKAKLDEVEVNISEAVVSVPQNLGHVTIEVVAVRPGDIVPPNQPVLRVLQAEDLWVKIFVPETKLEQVPLNKEVTVLIDSAKGTSLKGRIRQKASISEFTPRNVQSADERRFQVFAVKIMVEDTRGILNAGMAAEVLIPLD